MGILEAIRTILLKTGRNPVLKEKLTMRALKSEEDIKAGRMFDKEEVIRKTSSQALAKDSMKQIHKSKMSKSHEELQQKLDRAEETNKVTDVTVAVVDLHTQIVFGTVQ
jgi:hypothetical protein